MKKIKKALDPDNLLNPGKKIIFLNLNFFKFIFRENFLNN
jgi:hypothetical protein